MRDGITEEQHGLLTSWLGGFTVLEDHSWPLQDTNVLHVSTPAGGDFIIKASTTSHHIRREIAAHEAGLIGLEGKVPVLKHASAEAGILVTEFLPGTSIEGTAAEDDPETYRQAGALLAKLHRSARVSLDYAKALTYKTHSLIDQARGLLPESKLLRIAEELATLNPGPVQLVTTHGDYQPRNWLQHEGQIKVIDFGRADARPWVHDLVLLSHQHFLRRSALADAFYEGLGRVIESAEADMWRLENLNQAIATVVWAHQVGDGAFEQAGVEKVERVLAAV